MIQTIGRIMDLSELPLDFEINQDVQISPSAYQSSLDFRSLYPATVDVPHNLSYVHPLTLKRTPFRFDYNETIDIHLSPTYEEILNIIKISPNTYLNFNIIDNDTKSYGIGANRQIYTYVINNMINDLFEVTHGFFLDIKPSSFWHSSENIDGIVTLIGLYIESECKLPYHFHPVLLQKIKRIKMMSLKSQLKILRWFNNQMYIEINRNISDPEFDVEEITGYDTIEEYIWDFCFIKTLKPWKIDIYDKIAKSFRTKFDSIVLFGISKLDNIISGNYEINSAEVLNIMSLDDELHNNLWIQFINSLNQEQLKNLLLLCSNSFSLDEKFHITVLENMDQDIKIATCSRSVILNKRLFESIEMLNNLTLYLSTVDNTIVDVKNINQTPNFRYDDIENIIDTNLTGEDRRFDGRSNFHQLLDDVLSGYTQMVLERVCYEFSNLRWNASTGYGNSMNSDFDGDENNKLYNT